tara:strand:- start:279 stop:1391 length:1113 start_codon:yes stop_codon:yes gene_type:complete
MTTTFWNRYPLDSSGKYPRGTRLVPLDDVGLDPKESQSRDKEFNPDKIEKLENSVEKYGLKEAIGGVPTPDEWENERPVTVVHGVHRYGRARKLHVDSGLFPDGLPVLPETYQSVGTLAEKQFDKNTHEDKIHTPNEPQDLVRCIARVLADATMSPLGSGLVWTKDLFDDKSPAGVSALLKLHEEMTDYTNPSKSPRKLDKQVFKPAARAWVVDEVFKYHGAPPMRQLLLYTNDEVKKLIKMGTIVPGFNKDPGQVDGGLFVITMNYNDWKAKPMAILRYFMDTIGGTITPLQSKHVKIIVVAHHHKAETDKQLLSFRTNVERLCKNLNSFFSNNGNGAAFTKVVDEVVFLPQKQNRTKGNEKKSLVLPL